MKNSDGQILIVCLWVLSILAILAVSLGHRAAMGLKLSQYQVDKMKSMALARAGVNIVAGSTSLDMLSSGQYQEMDDMRKEAMNEIHLPDAPEGVAVIQPDLRMKGDGRSVNGVFDEESRLNINTASEGLLRELFDTLHLPEEDLAQDICAWRGDSGQRVPDYAGDGYSNKGGRFTTLEELMLVKGMDRSRYELVREYLTVWGDGAVNVNTASRVVLEALISYCYKQLGSGESDPSELVERIMAIRPVESWSELREKMQEAHELTSGQINILNELSKLVGFRSAYIHIYSTGRIISSKISSTIECVLNNEKGRVVFWHEN